MENNLAQVPTNTPAPKTNANAGSNANKATNKNANAGTDKNVVVVPPKISNPVGEESLLAVGTKAINFLLGMIVIVAVVVIIIAGFRMMLAGGNESQLTKAKKAILYAILGLVVALMSFAIVHIIQRLLS
jgi:hypothetical protein